MDAVHAVSEMRAMHFFVSTVNTKPFFEPLHLIAPLHLRQLPST